MSKKLLLGKQAQAALINGVEKLNCAVKVTLGAKGKTVIISKHGGNAPHITKDGVTVSEAIELEDPIENLAASIVKQAAEKTAKAAGDGTTTATILAHALINEGIRYINKGANPMDIKRGIDKAVIDAVLIIKELSLPVTPQKLKQIAIISANGDEQIGGLIADAFEKVGVDGVITVEESKSYETSVDIAEGMQVDKGYLSPYLLTDPGKKICEFNNPYIILIGSTVSMMSSLIPMLDKMVNFHVENKIPARPVVFIADNIKDEAMATLVVNHMRNIMQACVIGAPSFGPDRIAIVEDIAVKTGATFLMEDKGIKLEQAGHEHMGSAAKVIVEENRTLIIGGGGKEELLIAHVNNLKQQLADTEDERRVNFLRGRLARLLNGVGVIKVGGATEIEVMEKKDRIDDAICAIHSATQEGYVPGGGKTYLTAANLIDVEVENFDQRCGVDAVRVALLSPFLQIIHNAGIITNKKGWKARRLINKLQDHVMPGYGINLKNDQFEDLLEAGVVDPAKVSRVALENAASVAGIFLTTECVIQQ